MSDGAETFRVIIHQADFEDVRQSLMMALAILRNGDNPQLAEIVKPLEFFGKTRDTKKMREWCAEQGEATALDVIDQTIPRLVTARLIGEPYKLALETVHAKLKSIRD